MTTTHIRHGEAVERHEIVPGLMVVFDVDRLKKHDGVKLSWNSLDSKNRPFLCVAVEGSLSWWTPMTTKPRTAMMRARPAIESRWKRGGTPSYHLKDQFIHDGASVVVMAARAVKDLTSIELTTRHNRCLVHPEGVALCLAEIEAKKHRRINVIPDVPAPTEARA